MGPPYEGSIRQNVKESTYGQLFNNTHSLLMSRAAIIKSHHVKDSMWQIYLMHIHFMFDSDLRPFLNPLVY